jgi:hypothetical protein
MELIIFRLRNAQKFSRLRTGLRMLKLALFAALVALSVYSGYQWSEQQNELATTRHERDAAVTELRNKPTFQQQLEGLSVRDIMILKTRWQGKE